LGAAPTISPSSRGGRILPRRRF